MLSCRVSTNLCSGTSWHSHSSWFPLAHHPPGWAVTQVDINRDLWGACFSRFAAGTSAESLSERQLACLLQPLCFHFLQSEVSWGAAKRRGKQEEAKETEASNCNCICVQHVGLGAVILSSSCHAGCPCSQSSLSR